MPTVSASSLRWRLESTFKALTTKSIHPLKHFCLLFVLTVLPNRDVLVLWGRRGGRRGALRGWAKASYMTPVGSASRWGGPCQVRDAGCEVHAPGCVKRMLR
eukprot:1564335-Pyramimonas_sp.AAC.1